MTRFENKINLLDLDHEAFSRWLERQGWERYRAAQILRWVHSRRLDDFAQMTDVSKELRHLLDEHFYIGGLEKVAEENSRDGTRKFLFRLNDGHFIESVLIPERDHYTLCISSQVGCAMGCRFCLTGRSGLIRNLTAGEIVAQVSGISRMVEGGSGDSRRLTNVVLMGMGEPLANYDNVIHALRIVTDGNWGLKMSRNRVTLSTAGLIPEMDRLGADVEVNLAVSLNATTDSVRNLLMPVNRRYNLESLLAACRRFPLRPHRRITFEYILIRDINDSDTDAIRLSRLLAPIRSKINLIPLNPHEGCDFRCPDEEVIAHFHEILLSKHHTVIIRRSKGADISAACGQLRAKPPPDIPKCSQKDAAGNERAGDDDEGCGFP
jgi:23S rRNA (adenine2503-C2)-methyltransferase